MRFVGVCCVFLLFLVQGAISGVAPSGARFAQRIAQRKASEFPVEFRYGVDSDVPRNKEEERLRMEFLENHLARTLQTVVRERQRPIFTSALIAGDAVILDAIAKAGLLDRIPVIVVDTLHLFPETLDYLHEVEKYYNFKAQVYKPLGCDSRKQLAEKYGTHELWHDIAKYDRTCKVEPLQRALKQHRTDAWINGRRRDQGEDRARLLVWEQEKVNPLAHWTFEDCWAYLRRHDVPYHPLHNRGYPSVGDVHSTVPVDRARWLQYGGERSGRFQGMRNSDGSLKTECGIHTTGTPHE